MTERVLYDLDEQKYPLDQYAHPESISDEEALTAARLLTEIGRASCRERV